MNTTTNKTEVSGQESGSQAETQSLRGQESDVSQGAEGFGFREVPTGLVIPTPDNPRKEIDVESVKFKGLMESVRSMGILQPLVARPHAEKEGYFDLRAGHRRLAAARALGLEVVPVMVKDLTDQQAMEVTVTENLDREDLTALEEARGIERLMSVGLTAEQVANDFGRPVAWVRRRARLNALLPMWAEFGDLLEVSANHLELIARYDVVVQERLLEEFDIVEALQNFKDGQNVIYAVESFIVPQGVEELRRELSGMTKDLSLAEWAMGDAGLVSAAGACSACLRRTSCNPDLFGEAEGGKKGADFCLDTECWKLKMAAALERKFAKLQGEHGDAVRVSKKYEGKPAAGILGYGGYTESKKGAAGAVPALVMEGYHDVGKLLYVIPKSGRVVVGGSGGGAAGSGAEVVENVAAVLEEKRAGHERRRWALVIEKVIAAVKDSKEPVPASYKTPKGLVVLCAAFGVDSAFGSKEELMGTAVVDGGDDVDGVDQDDEEDDEEYLAMGGRTNIYDPWCRLKLLNAPMASPAAWVWRKLREKIVASLKVESPSAINEGRIEGVMVAAELVGLDALEMKMEADNALPEPKAWAKLVATSAAEVVEIDDRLAEAQGKTPKKQVRPVKGKEKNGKGSKA